MLKTGDLMLGSNGLVYFARSENERFLKTLMSK